MRALAQRGVMFGHQNTLAYGYNWHDEANRSDVKDVVGDYPAVYGWDVMDIFAHGRPGVFDDNGAAKLRGYVQQAHGRGGVSTFSWHLPNLANDTDAWNTTPAVSRIIPGGDLHEKYKARLDLVARFFSTLKDTDGKPIPVWFRPFHEHTGAWFWWGKPNANAADYIALWRFTVAYLRDVSGVHNVLYAYSTDVFDDPAQYFEYYPGDAWVDMLGFDDYHSIEGTQTRGILVRRLRSIVKWAADRGKIAALTETGREALPEPDWWTHVLLPGLKSKGVRGLSYVLVWRNADAGNGDRKEHFYAPYAGQKSADDFRRFYADPVTLFEHDLPALYVPSK